MPLKLIRPSAVLAVSLTAGVAGFFIAALSAQGPGVALPADVPDFEGGWVRVDPYGSGSYGGLLRGEGYTQASLLPEAEAARGRGGRGGRGRGNDDDVAPPDAPNPVGIPYVVTSGRCGGGGPGRALLEFNSAAFFMLQSHDRVLIVRESAGARPIFTDGRPHPAPGAMEPNANGFSTGRYENGELVVETDGLSEGNVTLGGYRTPETKLTQRFTMSPDGQKLTITYTWEDPKIYRTPHTYQMFFERIPPDGYALENWCDGSDPETGYSITPPEQLGDQ
jgi:hypothetical protein